MMMTIRRMMLLHGRGRVIFFIPLILLCFGLAPCPFVQAQQLEALLKSQMLHQAAPRTSHKIAIPSWLSKDSNYYALFSDAHADRLIKILGKEFEGYRLAKVEVKPDQQFKEYSLWFDPPNTNTFINVILYMPHPALLDLAESHSLVEQGQLIPLSPEGKDAIDFDGVSWTYYDLSEGKYAFTCELPMSGMLLVESDKEESMLDARALIRKFNIGELIRQLSS